MIKIQGSSILPDKTRQVDSRRVIFPAVLISATTSGGANTFLTAPDQEMAQLDKVTVTNSSGSVATLAFCAIPDGGSYASGDEEFNNISIGPGVTDITDNVLGLYAPKTTIAVYSDTTNVLTIRAAATAFR